MVSKLYKEKQFKDYFLKAQEYYLKSKFDKAVVQAKNAKANAVSPKEMVRASIMQIRCFISLGMYFQAKACINDVFCIDEFNDQAIAYNYILEAQCIEPSLCEQKEKEIDFWCKVTRRTRREISPDTQFEYLLSRAIDINPRLTNSEYRTNANNVRGYSRYNKSRYEEAVQSFDLAMTNDKKSNTGIAVWKETAQAVCDFLSKDKEASIPTLKKLLFYAEKGETIAKAVLNCFKNRYEIDGLNYEKYVLPKKYLKMHSADMFMVNSFINSGDYEFVLKYIKNLEKSLKNGDGDYTVAFDLAKVYSLYNMGEKDLALKILANLNAVIGDYTYGIQLYALILAYIRDGVEKLDNIEIFTGLPKRVLDDIDCFINKLDKLNDEEVVQSFREDYSYIKIFLRLLVCTKYYQIYNYDKEYGKIVIDRLKSLSGENYDIKMFFIDLLKISTSDINWSYRYILDSLVDMDIEGLTIVYMNYDRTIVNTVTSMPNVLSGDLLKKAYDKALKLCLRCRTHSVEKLNRQFKRIYGQVSTQNMDSKDINAQAFLLVYGASSGENMDEIFDEISS